MKAKYLVLLLILLIFQLSIVTQAALVTKKTTKPKDKREVDRYEDEDKDQDSNDDSSEEEEEEEISVQIVKSSSKDIYELRMRKYPSKINFNTGQVISRPSSNCDKAHSGFFHNTSWSTSFCIIPDLAYNVEVTVGNPKYRNFELFNMMVDINQPWTWIKSRTCKSCKSLSEYSQSSLETATCSNSCLTNVRYDPLKSKVKPGYQGKQASITGFEQGVYGGFFYDQLSFLAYQPNQNITLGAILKEKLSPIKFNALEDFFTISQIKMVSAEKIINFGSFNASGVLGLAHTDTEFDLPNIEEETSFMNQLISEEESKLEDEDNIFGVYLNSFSKEYALTLGGYNGEYSPELTLSEYWIDLKQNKKKSNYQYTIGLSSLRSSSVTYTTQTTTESILTLSSTFLSVPWDVLKRMINDWNTKYSMDCQIIDSHYQVVFCKRIVLLELEGVNLEFEFTGGVQYKIPLESFLRDCSHGQKPLYIQDIQRSVANECVLSIGVSQDSKRFILGNSFLDKHYTLFDLKNNRIAFLPPTERSFFAEEDDRRQYVELLVTIVAIIFTVGMAILFCQQRLVMCFRGTLLFVSKVIDWQKIIPKRKSQQQRMELANKSQQFQQLPENELDVSNSNNGDNNGNGFGRKQESLKNQQTQLSQEQQQQGQNRKKIFIVNKAPNNPLNQQYQPNNLTSQNNQEDKERKAALVSLDLI